KEIQLNTTINPVDNNVNPVQSLTVVANNPLAPNKNKSEKIPNTQILSSPYTFTTKSKHHKALNSKNTQDPRTAFQVKKASSEKISTEERSYLLAAAPDNLNKSKIELDPAHLNSLTGKPALNRINFNESAGKISKINHTDRSNLYFIAFFSPETATNYLKEDDHSPGRATED